MGSLDMRRREFNKAKQAFDDATRRYDKVLEGEGIRFVREHLIIEQEGGDIVFKSPDGGAPRVSKLAAKSLTRFFTAWKGVSP